MRFGSEDKDRNCLECLYQTEKHLNIKRTQLSLKKRLVHCYVLSTFLYASESWTLNKQIEDRINALEMWIYRRMLKVSYTDRVSSEEILRRVGGKRNLVRMIKTRKMQYFEHIVRADGMQRLCWMEKLKESEGDVPKGELGRKTLPIGWKRLYNMHLFGHQQNELETLGRRPLE